MAWCVESSLLIYLFRCHPTRRPIQLALCLVLSILLPHTSPLFLPPFPPSFLSPLLAAPRCQVVLMRVHASSSDLFDRQTEIDTFKGVSTAGLGPRLLLLFRNGRVEEFLGEHVSCYCLCHVGLSVC